MREANWYEKQRKKSDDHTVHCHYFTGIAVCNSVCLDDYKFGEKSVKSIYKTNTVDTG